MERRAAEPFYSSKAGVIGVVYVLCRWSTMLIGLFVCIEIKNYKTTCQKERDRLVADNLFCEESITVV